MEKSPTAASRGTRKARRRTGADSGLRALEFLTRVFDTLHGERPFEQAVEAVVRELRSFAAVDRFCLSLWNERANALEPAIVLRLDDPDDTASAPSVSLHGVAGACAMLRRPVRKHAASTIDDSTSPSGRRVCSEIAVPMILRRRLVGVLYAMRFGKDAYDDRDEHLFRAVATQMLSAIESTRLRARHHRREQDLEQERVTVREIQASLLSGPSPRVKQLDIGTAYRPVTNLGGDFFDFLSVGDHRLAVAIGDVAGKGTPAALYGSLAVGMMRGQIVEEPLAPAEMLRRLNDQLYGPVIENRFVAMAFGVFDGSDRTLVLANAGFTRPILVRGRRQEKIDVRGVPLGLLPGIVYDQHRIALRPGDIVVFCSDGLQEAIDGLGQQFGDRFLEDVVEALVSVPAQQIAEGLLRASTAYAGDEEELADDRSVVVLKIG